VATVNSLVCAAATSNLNAVGLCNKNSMSANYLNSGQDCCYDNNNQAKPTFGDLSNIISTTIYNNIGIPAYLYNAP
jgi:hypothetical protein